MEDFGCLKVSIDITFGRRTGKKKICGNPEEREVLRCSTEEIAIIRSVMTITKMKSWDAKSCRHSRKMSFKASTSLTNAQPREYTTHIDGQHRAKVYTS